MFHRLSKDLKFVFFNFHLVFDILHEVLYISHVLNEQGTGYEHIFSSVQTFNID